MKPRVLESRVNKGGFRVRRYGTPGERWSTIEVPLDLWKRLVTAGRARDRVAEARRADARDALRRRALAMTGSAAEVAEAIGASKRSVQRWRAEEQARRVEVNKATSPTLATVWR